jgi:hypothetical protein
MQAEAWSLIEMAEQKAGRRSPGREFTSIPYKHRGPNPIVKEKLIGPDPALVVTFIMPSV